MARVYYERMRRTKQKPYRFGVGEIVLFTYLITVIMIAITRRLFGFPTVNELASSPALLLHGNGGGYLLVLL